MNFPAMKKVNTKIQNKENDSVSTFKYFNSYKKDTTTVKILRIKNEWLVDLKEFMKLHK
jgi:hypothetical protein